MAFSWLVNGVTTHLLTGMILQMGYTLPETNRSHPTMDGWKMKSPFRMAHFQGLNLLSGRVTHL